MGNSILDINNVSKSFYRKTSGNNSILKNFSLTIEKEKITALIGGNGTGKTTLFNIICGFLRPDKADDSDIIFNGEIDILKAQPWKIPQMGIGRLFQEARVFPELTIAENMKIADPDYLGEGPFESLLFRSKIKKKEAEREDKVMTIFSDLFGENSIFIERPEMKVKNLSYGQQRLLSLAQLLMGNYSLILLDEPTSGVNPRLIHKISEIILLLKSKGKAVFLIEHNMTFIRQTANDVAFILNGEIYRKGSPENLLKDEFIIKNYLGIV